MPSKMTDARLLASLVQARKERAALDTRHERAQAAVASYDADVKEVNARIDYLATIATQRGIDALAGDDVVDAQVVDDTAPSGAPVPA